MVKKLCSYIICLIFIFSSLVQADDTPVVQSEDAKFGLENELRDPVTKLLLIANPISLLAFAALTSFLHDDFSLIDGAAEIGLYSQMWFASGFVNSPYNKFAYFMRQKLLLSKKAPFYMRDGKFIDKETGVWLERGFDRFVVEVRSKPATYVELRESYQTLDGAMFNPIRNFGISTANFLSNGHLHMDIETAFSGDINLFRDFIADMLHHPGLLEGIFSQVLFNTSSFGESSRPLTYYSQAIVDVLSRVDSGDITEVPELVTGLMKAGMNGRVPSVNVQQGKGTIEMRFFRSARTSEEILALTELLQKRLDYLRKNPGVSLELPLVPKKMSFASKVLNLKSYIEQTGLSWDRYESLMTKSQRLRYRLSNFFHSPEAKSLSCLKVLR